MTNDDLKTAYAEVLDILNYIGSDYISLIPDDTMQLFERECDKDYLHKLKADSRDATSKEYSEEALAIIAYLNLKYWCEDDAEKKYYKDLYLSNPRNLDANLIINIKRKTLLCIKSFFFSIVEHILSI